MKNTIQLISTMATAVLFLGLTSCRSNDTDNNLNPGGIAAVNFNLTGTDYSDGASAQASLSKGIGTGNEVQRQSILIDPSTVITLELSDVPSLGSSAQASLNGINPVAAATPGNNLGKDVTYRLLVYEKNNSTLITSADYKVGTPPQAMNLEVGKTYSIVAYSNGGTTALPQLANTDWSNATVAYDNNNPDFMYWQGDFTPVQGHNNLNITLRHKTTMITTKVFSNGLGNITGTVSGTLSPHYTSGTIPLSTGALPRSGTPGNRTLVFSAKSNTEQDAAPVLVNVGTGAAVKGSFTGSANVGGTVRTISSLNSFNITPESQKILNVNMNRCGAYLGATFKEFQCQNLGATSSDPFALEAGNHGAKYQWGIKTPALTQAQDQANSGVISGWNTSNAPNGSWNLGTEAAPVKNTANDPCPSGYRIPTNTEWSNVLNTARNFKEYVGTNWTASSTNYNNALRIHDTNLSGATLLQLPAAGYREMADGGLGFRGSRGSYWSSSESTNPNDYPLVFSLYFDSSSATVNYTARIPGFPVRCIAE
ncbi:FISUMP domain-containing protein [Elizabethkingia ursingii]|uniref:Fibrobacter succinogenes major paralogous domain-containing protein n=1 Tax=Elizabethkingia ursingii TaxID=1756150 RepID=A0ABX3N8A1_9FLAO|nr:FISUMP domain-containing protein [Elizabethkingia ursingii]OPB88544.1 hypothetical protein BB021_08325 [Elizabethkingia ursingii]